MSFAKPVQIKDIAVVKIDENRFLWISNNARRALKGAR